MSDEVNYKGWALEMCSLLDAIEIALGNEDLDTARIFLKGRFRIAEAHGLKAEFMDKQAAGIQ